VVRRILLVRVRDHHPHGDRRGGQRSVSEPSRENCATIWRMRAVVSRVSAAAVTVDGGVVGEIGRGLLSLVGVTRTDDAGTAATLARKMHELRIFPGDGGEVSAADLGLPVLVVSQFTLYADTRKGRRPSWQDAAPGEMAEPLVEAVVAELRARGATVATGRFGARMQVSSVNDGPFTVILEV
jgi:D-tyrosyl-tRNA(Tyr) deacylase